MKPGQVSIYLVPRVKNKTTLFLTGCLGELVTVSRCWRSTLIWYLLCFGYTLSWVKIVAVRKISVNHEVMLTLWAKVRWEGQTEKWRQEGKRARRGAKCQRKLSFFNELAFLLCAQEGRHAFSQERRAEAPLAALCQRSDHQCQQRSLALPLAAAEKLRTVPDPPNYSLWSLAPRKQKISTFSFQSLHGSLSPRYPASLKGCLAGWFY